VSSDFSAAAFWFDAAEVLRELSWSGVPAVVRPMTWMLLSVRSNADLAHAHALNMTAKAPELSCRKHGPRTSHVRNPCHLGLRSPRVFHGGCACVLSGPCACLFQGYVPVNVDRRETTLTRKREEYMGFVGTYWETRHQEGDNKKTFHQIQIDLPRTNPAPLFQLDVVMRVCLFLLLGAFLFLSPFPFACACACADVLSLLHGRIAPFRLCFLDGISAHSLKLCGCLLVRHSFWSAYFTFGLCGTLGVATSKA